MAVLELVLAVPELDDRFAEPVRDVLAAERAPADGWCGAGTGSACTFGA
ncbi:hypothetical protein B0I31_10172 [Saccharothrix carnea]|uniref:Uncharacterized protein n=1 Tax=Saccharothrix carnea TaxID=1280637 RepID=A0A2P8IHD7_SACCR|nr:hypothetical protein [Saccharothrix carnea]PSL57861.1 hypothetical protein B0I31_10172 [Saccharothrix carnea]